MTPRTDVCAICDKYRDDIKTATSESEKNSFTLKFSNHLSEVQTECQHYLDCCKRSKSELPGNAVPNFAYYTFDFAEQLHLPHHSR